MQGISRPVVIANASSFSAIYLDDSADAEGRAVTLDVIGTFDGIFGTVEGLSLGIIWFKRADLRSLDIQGSSHLDFFQVENTAQSGIFGGSACQTSMQSGRSGRKTGTWKAMIHACRCCVTLFSGRQGLRQRRIRYADGRTRRARSILWRPRNRFVRRRHGDGLARR